MCWMDRETEEEGEEGGGGRRTGLHAIAFGDEKCLLVKYASSGVQAALSVQQCVRTSYLMYSSKIIQAAVLHSGCTAPNSKCAFP